MNGDVISSLISIRPDLLWDRLIYRDQHGGFLHVVLEYLPLSWSQLDSSGAVSVGAGVGAGGDALKSLVSDQDCPQSRWDEQDVVSTLDGLFGKENLRLISSWKRIR